VTPTVQTTPAPTPLVSLRELIGTIVDDRYEIRRLVACGGMGAVYEALQLQLDRRVAIKILNPAFMHRDDYVARFLQEAKAASRIRHENVVQMLDFGKLGTGCVYSVMEFLEGCDLGELLRRETKLPWARARVLLLQAIRGVEAAHARGVIHRDIKPANLFVARMATDGQEAREVLKVLDFGVARVQSSSSETTGLTATADLVGTPAYMAPELARGRRAGPRTEVYSIGVVAYRLLTGQLPFRGDSPFDALFRAATEPTPPLRSHDPDVPPEVEAVVMRMLAKDPEDRFADMATLHRAIEAIDEQGRRSADPISIAEIERVEELPPTVRRRPRVSSRQIAGAMIGTVLVGLAAIAALDVDRALAWPDARTTAVATMARPPDAMTVSMLQAPPVPSAATQRVAVERTVDVVVEDDEPSFVPPPTPRRTKAKAVVEVPRGAIEPAPEEPRTDADVLRRIERRARGSCGAEIGDQPMVITFGIGQRGEVLAPRGNRKGPATDCVLRLLAGARFPAGRMRKETLSL